MAPPPVGTCDRSKAVAPPPPSFTKTFVSAACAGSVQAIVDQPLAALKTRSQCLQPLRPAPSPPKPILAGFSANLATKVVRSGVVYTAYRIFDETMPNVPQGVKGASAGFMEVVFTNWLRRIAVITQSPNNHCTDSLAALKWMCKEEGVTKAAFGGFWATAARSAVAFGFYFPTLEFLKDHRPEDLSEAQRRCYALGASGVAAVPAVFFSNWLDVVKTVRQSHVGASPPSMRDILQQVVKTKGLRGLFSGAGYNVVRVGPPIAIAYVVKEEVEKRL